MFSKYKKYVYTFINNHWIKRRICFNSNKLLYKIKSNLIQCQVGPLTDGKWRHLRMALCVDRLYKFNNYESSVCWLI